MNILLCTTTSTYTNSQVGGAQTSIRLIGERMAELGHNVFYLTSSDGDSSGEELIDGVHVVFYPKHSKQSLFRKILKKRKKKFAGEELEMLIEDIVCRNNIELVYLHYHPWLLQHVINLRQKKRFIVVMRMAGLMWYEYSKKDPKKKREFEKAFSAVDSINYNTPGLWKLTYQYAKQIDFRYQPKDEFVADIGGFTKARITKEDSGEPSKPFRLLVATRFSNYQKRQDILVKALKLLPRDIDVELKLIGTGPKLEYIQNMVASYGLAEKVTFIPFLPQEELWKQMVTSDLLCHPCEYEGLSKIIVESMFIGLPVLASDVLPLDDYVQHEQTGFLVENNPERWAQAIDRLVHSPDQLRSVALRAREYAFQEFDSKRKIADYEAHFKRLLAVSKA